MASRRPQALLGPDRRLVDVNPAFCALVRRPRPALIGAEPDFLHPLRDGAATLVDPQGGREAVSLGLIPLTDGGTLIDVEPGSESRLHTAERINREMRAVIENTYEFIGLLSPEGLVIDANRTALSFLDLPDVSSLIGTPFVDTPWWTHSSTERSTLLDAVRRASAGEFVRFETTHRDADGRIAHIDFSLKPVLDPEGVVVYLVPEGRDITQRKRVEADLLAAKLEAEAANRAKSTFLATVSHELRTPLNAVIGFSEAIVSNAMGPFDSERTLDYLRMIHAAGQHLGGLIEDILDVSRVELGQVRLAEDRVDAGEMIASVRRLTEHKAIEGGIRLAVEYPPDLPMVCADARRMRQILLNLLVNALKFTPPGGLVTVRAGLNSEQLVIEIEDTGIGIPAEHLTKVWQPFFQSDASLARRHEGSGLGLTIVKHFVEAHGGHVFIESRLGQGTRVGLRLPRDRLLDTNERQTTFPAARR